jgi:hypothetical protein
MSFITDFLEWIGLLDAAATVPTPPTKLFPTAAYADPFTASTKMQTALDTAIAAAETKRSQAAGSFPIPITIAEITGSTGPFPVANYKENEVDFIASEAKVLAMYAAFELREMLKRFATAIGATSQAQVFKELKAKADPFLLTQVPAIRDGKHVTGATVAPPLKNVHRLPLYDQVFTATPNSSGGVDIDFVPSSNSAAATCIQGVGYSYLNATLAAAGFLTLDPTGALAGTTGAWLAGDYMGTYPKVRGVMSSNDGPAGIAGTTHQMARIMALINMSVLVNSASSGEMDTLMKAAAAGPDQPFASREPKSAPLIPRSKYVYNKLGLERLKPDSSGPQVASECSLISGPVAAGRQYAVAWQNWQGVQPYTFADIAKVIIDTITQFEI